jgi:lytic murein transglycosylase
MSEQLARCRAEAAPIYQAASFDDYLNRVRATARRCGIRSSAIAALSGLERRASYDIDRFPAGLYPQVAALPQEDLREFKPNPTRKYVEQRIERLSEQGRELLDRHRALLKRVEARYGVPAEYIVAFWGIETNYGGFVGEHDVVETLANLGHSSSRRRFFTEELLAALILLDRGHVRRGFKGSYAGAFGQAQFMPTSYIQNAVDFDGDGRADLYGSLPDVFASIANYEVQRGRWDGKVGTALAEVRLPRDFPHAEADIENRREAGYWASLGVKRADGEPLSDHLGPAAILLPAGCKGPAFLATQNFFAVMDYNPLVDYAMAVSLLAETLRHGEYRLAQAWPDEEPLSAGDRARLQELLARRGHGDLAIDGRIGRESRAAIRRAQAALGQCADGYATATLLYALDQQDKPAIRIARDEPKQRRGWFPAQAGTRKAQTRKKRGG